MTSIIKSNHHFNTNVHIVVNDDLDILHIYCNNKDYMRCDSSDDFIKKLQIIFRFTGIDLYPDNKWSKEYVPFGESITKDDKQMDYESLKKLINNIYNLPLDFDFKFINSGICGCNMGHCSTVIGYNLDNSNYTKYGQIMRKFGLEYPDSVLLFIEKIDELESEYPVGWCSNKQKVKNDIVLDPNIVYLTWYYNR